MSINEFPFDKWLPLWKGLADGRFSIISNDLRFCALNVLVLPMTPIRAADSTGDAIIVANATLSIDSGLKICWPPPPLLVKLLRLEFVSDGVPAWLNKPIGFDTDDGLKTAAVLTVWFGVMLLFVCGLLVLKTVVPMPLDSVFRLVCVGLVFNDSFGLAIGYRQNSWPSNASDESCCRFWASRKALGRDSCTGSSSLRINTRQDKMLTLWIVIILCYLTSIVHNALLTLE